MFSLNIEEACSQSIDRILSIIVCFFDNDAIRVTTQHMASRNVNIANSSALMVELKDVLHSNGLEWKRVTSILLDNCAVTRGKKTRLDTQARKENPYLLDISGHTVHMVSKCHQGPHEFCLAQKLTISALMYIMILRSHQNRRRFFFSEFQILPHLPPKSLIKLINNRFLQMLEAE